MNRWAMHLSDYDKVTHLTEMNKCLDRAAFWTWGYTSAFLHQHNLITHTQTFLHHETDTDTHFLSWFHALQLTFCFLHIKGERSYVLTCKALFDTLYWTIATPRAELKGHTTRVSASWVRGCIDKMHMQVTNQKTCSGLSGDLIICMCISFYNKTAIRHSVTLCKSWMMDCLKHLIKRWENKNRWLYRVGMWGGNLVCTQLFLLYMGKKEMREIF